MTETVRGRKRRKQAMCDQGWRETDSTNPMWEWVCATCGESWWVRRCTECGLCEYCNKRCANGQA